MNQYNTILANVYIVSVALSLILSITAFILNPWLKRQGINMNMPKGFSGFVVWAIFVMVPVLNTLYAVICLWMLVKLPVYIRHMRELREELRALGVITTAG